MQPGMLMQLPPRCRAAPAPEQRGDAFTHHQRADNAKDHDIEKRDRNIHLAPALQQGKNLHPKRRTKQPTGEKREPHAPIHIAAPPLRN